MYAGGIKNSKIASRRSPIKLINELTKCDWKLFFKRNEYITRGHRDKLYKLLAKANLSLNSFSKKVINEWNNLQNKVINSHDLDEFKKEYDKISGPKKLIVNSI